MVVYGEITDFFRLLKITVINHKGNMHIFPELFAVLLAISHKNQPLHVPHRCKADNILPLGGDFYHHKIPRPVNFPGQGIYGGRDKTILQNVSLVFFVVIHYDSNNFRIVLRQQNSRHTWDIRPFFQKLLHTLYRFIGNLLCLSMYHI